MTNRNRNANDAAASNENNMSQEVNINLAGLDGGNASGTGGDCFGKCNNCKSTTPNICVIAQSHLPKPEPERVFCSYTGCN